MLTQLFIFDNYAVYCVVAAGQLECRIVSITIAYLPHKLRLERVVDLRNNIAMGKNKSGHYVPPKGKPSGNGRESRGLTDAFSDSNDLERDNRIAEKYTDTENESLSKNVPVKHTNRHLHKGEDLPEYQEPPDNG